MKGDQAFLRGRGRSVCKMDGGGLIRFRLLDGQKASFLCHLNRNERCSRLVLMIVFELHKEALILAAIHLALDLVARLVANA